MEEKNAIAVIGVCKTESPIQWMGILPDTLEMDKFLVNVKTQPSLQNQSISYRINGAIYLLEVESIVRHGTLFPKSGAYAYVMDREVSVDVDTKFEFDIVECLIVKQEQTI
jgi:CMP-N-acetylneuraminic acid synthetase